MFIGGLLRVKSSMTCVLSFITRGFPTSGLRFGFTNKSDCEKKRKAQIISLFADLIFYSLKSRVSRTVFCLKPICKTLLYISINLFLPNFCIKTYIVRAYKLVIQECGSHKANTVFLSPPNKILSGQKLAA